MVINDIFDLEIDKINHPERPIVSGQVSIIEAALLTALLLGGAELLAIVYLPPNLQTIIHFATTIVIIYTPLLKKIPVVKNIVCSGLVAFSVFLGGLSSTHQYLATQPNFDILSITMSFVFMGSIYNELLLDMRDIDGDRKNGIYTIPVFIGKPMTWVLVHAILVFNIVSNSFALSYLCRCNTSIFVPILFIPVFYYLYFIKHEHFSESSIKKALSNTTQTLIFLFVYLGMFVYSR
jgi:geranylgeranylglycerol-phosphate geranylgeranyltransferase